MKKRFSRAEGLEGHRVFKAEEFDVVIEEFCVFLEESEGSK